MQETSLHASLKTWYGKQGGEMEVRLDGFLIDVLQQGTAIEIQTRNFRAIKSKLITILEHHPVRLVHPIAQEKWIVYLPTPQKQATIRRKSPRHGRLEYVFYELISIPQLIFHPNFSREIVLTKEEEIRSDDGQGSWRRQGISIADRCLIEVVDRKQLCSPEDYRIFLPPHLPMSFTRRELASASGLSQSLASKMAYCLSSIGIIKIIGKRGRQYLYSKEG